MARIYRRSNSAVYALPPGENRAAPVGPAVAVRLGKGLRNKSKLIFLLLSFLERFEGLCVAQFLKYVSFRGREKVALPDRPDESSEVGSLERAQKVRRGPTLSSRSQAQFLVFWLGRRRALEEINSVSSNSPSSGLPPPLRASGEGTSQVDPSACLPDVQETSSWRFLYDNKVPILENPESLALVWRKIREKGCELPSLDDMRERDAYVRMAVANAKAMEASNEYAALMEKRLPDFQSKKEQREVEVEGLKGKLVATEAEKVAIQNDLDLMKEKHRRKIEGREATALKEHSLARSFLAREYDAVLAVVKDKLQKKKEETAAEIRLQEVRARIEALTEYSEGGFELEEELGRLRDREISLDLDYGVASVSDPSLSRLELPEVSGDSVDQE
ncbi:hypothetical protein F2Q69_00035505 [Brassica cretica]|uniref:Uncharacterized protein n=1 Tax=Brassica cretica TaxID=69181 RepID=A0A8S9SFN9_BRACR|nr:hypothetical protein F2Q69_00035505 [Brassica cretica]